MKLNLTHNFSKAIAAHRVKSLHNPDGAESSPGFAFKMSWGEGSWRGRGAGGAAGGAGMQEGQLQGQLEEAGGAIS